jgi:hypothetical protein
MADRLVKEGVIPEGDLLWAREVLAGCWVDRIAIVWNVEDVLDTCGWLTEDQANEVLWAVHEHQDADLGVTWDTLRQTAQELYPHSEDSEDEDDQD